ncbi:cobalt ECF transporter T component CbiQ [Magnetospira thiophila]
MWAIDTWAHSNRWATWHAGEKLFLALGLLLTVLLAPPLTTVPLVLILLTWSVVKGAGIPLKVYLAVLALPSGFLLFSAPLLAVGLRLEPSFALTFSPEGLRQGGVLLVRALGAVACLGFLVLTTPVTDLLPLLLRLRVPPIIVELAFLIYRFIFLLVGTLVTGYQAQLSRGGYDRPRLALRSAGQLGGGLFLRTLERARRLEQGMASRGFEGEFHMLATRRPLSQTHLWACAVGIALPALIGPVLWWGLR